MSISLLPSSVDLGFAQAHLYDVVVVGAGPGGCSSACHLAASGADVLLVDRLPFPRDKRCGDAVMPLALDELALLGLRDEMDGRFAAVERVALWHKGLPGGFQPLDGGRGYVAARAQFDALLLAQAIRRGASWLDRVSVQGLVVEQTGASLQCRRDGSPVMLQARLVIAADGSGSRLARWLRASSPRHPAEGESPLTAPQDDRARFTAMRGYCRGFEGLGHGLEFYFRAETGTHYYWVFPCGQGLANVGVIASMAQLRAGGTDLAQALCAFLHSPELEGRGAGAQLVGRWGAAPIAAGLRGAALFGPRVLCVGDAAALVDPQTAEGISGALWSGRMAAATATESLANNDFSPATLSGYGAAVRTRYQSLYDKLLGAG